MTVQPQKRPTRRATWALIRAFYATDIVARGKEPELFLTVAFLLTFAAVRLIAYSIKYDWTPVFRNVQAGDVHIHHMVPGMILVLVSGYLGLAMGMRRPTRLLAVLFGIGAALVLDEFALWLRLEDVYWQPQGRESIDAVIVATVLTILYLLELAFWRHLARAVLRRILWRRHTSTPPPGTSLPRPEA